MEEEKIDKGILITRDLLDRNEVKGKEIRMIPAWLFLMVMS
jgi:predicted AAA+ superfamily ATPase